MQTRVLRRGLEAITGGRSAWRQVVGLSGDYLKLSKHKLSGLVVYTGIVGYVVGSEYSDSKAFDAVKLGWTTAGIGLCAASANALNQWYEMDRDAKMARTRLRPLPAGRMSPLHALAFAAAAGVVGVTILKEKTDEVTAALGAANIALYAGVYTPLKVIHPVNTWVGAIVGAIPPVMGWSAATGGDLSHPGCWLLGGMLFVWQIPHFHALAAVCAKDYQRGGYKMLAQTEPKLNARVAALMAYSLLPLGPLAIHFNLTTPWFAAEALGLNFWIIHGAEKFIGNPTSSAAARPLFRASISYLPVILGAMMLHRKTAEQREAEAEKKGAAQSRFALEAASIFSPHIFMPCPRFVRPHAAPQSDTDTQRVASAAPSISQDVKSLPS